MPSLYFRINAQVHNKTSLQVMFL